MPTYREQLAKTAAGLGIPGEPIIDEVKEQRNFAYQLDRPEILANAEFLGYYDIARLVNPLLKLKGEEKLSAREAQDAYYERLEENLTLFDMTPDQMIKVGVKRGIPKKELQGRGPAEMANIILSGGVPREEYEAMVQEAEQEQVENIAQKWEDVEKFGKELAKTRTKYEKDLKKKGLPRSKILATVVGLMDKSLMRIGGEKSAGRSADPTFGASTLSPENLTLDKKSKTAEFDYIGKKQVVQEKKIEDKDLFNALAEIYDTLWSDGKQCVDERGNKRLFCYLERGKPIPIKDSDVREYLNSIAGTTHTHFFRFWHGTNMVRDAVEKEGIPYSEAVARASKALGHMRTNRKTGEMEPDTGATAQKSYINPDVIAKYGKGRAERVPVYKATREAIASEAKVDTSDWDRGMIVEYLRANPKSKAWSEFLG